MFVHIASIADTIVTMMLANSVTSKVDTTVVAIDSGAVVGVNTARSVVVVVLLRIHVLRLTTPPVSCPPTVVGVAATTLRGRSHHVCVRSVGRPVLNAMVPTMTIFTHRSQ